MKKGYLVLGLLKDIQIEGIGGQISVPSYNEKTKLIGVVPVYTTKRQAQKKSENGRYKIMEIWLEEK